MSKSPTGSKMAPSNHERERTQRLGILLATALISVLLWQTAPGRFLLYPFTILATWFHEMGHGIAAMLLGSSFERLVIYPDGSGVALSLRPADASRIGNAVIAASGPLGPAIAGAFLILASRTRDATQVALAVLGLALIASTIIWVRTVVGWVTLPALGAVVLLVAFRGTTTQQRFLIQLLGVQACISVWQQFGYLFSSGARVGGQLHQSDTAAMADALLLPFWFWGAAISAAIVAILWWSLRRAFQQ